MLLKLSKKGIRSILPKSFYKLLAESYKAIFPEKRILDISMLKHNEDIFQKLKINLDNLKTILNNTNVEYQDCLHPGITIYLQALMIFLRTKHNC